MSFGIFEVMSNKILDSLLSSVIPLMPISAEPDSKRTSDEI